MDDYLRGRYKGPASENPTRPPKRYKPPQPERLQRQPAKPMFPVNPRPPHQAAPMFPISPSTSHHKVLAHKQPVSVPQAKPRRHPGLGKILIITFVLGVLASGAGYYHLKYANAPTPLPRQLVKALAFPVYYPTNLPAGYKYQPGSANNQKGLLIYRIADGSNGVVLTEQNKPDYNFNPAGLPNFKSISTGDGSAVIGTSNGAITVVYATSTTLINMTAVNSISRANMITIAQNLRLVKK